MVVLKSFSGNMTERNTGSSEDLIDLHRRHFLKGVAASPFAGAALSTGARAESNRQIAIRQGGSVVDTVVPYSYDDMNVEEFYNYDGRHRSGSGDGASANTPNDLEEDGVSQLFFYEHEGTLSLVMIHDQPNSSSGGSVRMDFQSLPDSGQWTVKDDITHAPDEYGEDGTYARWRWGRCCTDGGAYSWEDTGDFEFTITPREYDGGTGDPFGGIHTWQLLSGDGSSEELSAGQSVTVSVGESTSPGPDIGGLVDEKLALADRIDTNAMGLMDDRARVEPALDGLVEAAESDEGADRSEAVEAVQRMVAGERVTDAVLAGAGPGSSPHLDVDTNISKLTSKYAVNPIIEVIFAGISILRAARVIPGLGGLVDDAARWLGNAVADLAGIYSATLERLIRARARETGLAIFGAAESKAEEKGKKISEEEFKEVRDTEGAAFIEDSSAVIFQDMLFNEERDWAGNETDPLDESVDELVDGLDADDGLDLEGDTDQSLAAADERLAGVNEDYENIDHQLTDSLFALFLRYLGIVEGVLAAVAVVASVTGVLSAAGPVAAAGAALVGFGGGVLGSLIQWGVGAGGILEQRYSHQLAVEEILDPTGV